MHFEFTMLLNLLSKVSALALCGVTITVTAAGDPNAEGTKGSAIKLEDTDDGFNVTDSGGMRFPFNQEPLLAVWKTSTQAFESP